MLRVRDRQITKTGINGKTASVSFTVTNVTHATLAYQSSANHDPDMTDSNGTIIVVSKP